MSFRKMILGAVASLPMMVIGLLALTAFSADTVNACLPCMCEENRTLNCFGDYAAYTPINEEIDACSIEIYGVPKVGDDYLAISIDAEELAELPESPEENMLIDEEEAIALYWLTSNEYQINFGPDEEGKVFTLNFNSCPAEDVKEETFIPGAEAEGE